MNARSHFFGLVVTVLAVIVSGTGVLGAETSVTGQMLSVVPSDAWGVIVIKDLSKMSSLIDGYATRLGVEKPDILKKVVRKLGVGTMVDMSKPMVIVVMNKQLYGDQPVAAILSVKEYDNFAAAFGGKATDVPGLMKGENEELGECYFTRNICYKKY